MTLYCNELRQQARELATLSRQADLRRAVSSAYYSVFHLLLDEFSRQVLASLRRSVTHTAMAKACSIVIHVYRQQTTNPTWNINQPTGEHGKKVILPLRGVRLSAELFDVASNFVALQNARHVADYATPHRTTRQDALSELAKCDAVHAAWGVCRQRREARALLLMFILDFEALRDR